MGTPSQLSHAIQEVCHRLLIVCLGLKGTVPDSTGVLCLRGRRGGQITTLGEDLLLVGVGVVASHVVCLNFSHYRHRVSSTATSLVPLAQPTTRGRPVCIINPPEVRGSIVQLLQLVVLHYTYQGLNP